MSDPELPRAPAPVGRRWTRFRYRASEAIARRSYGGTRRTEHRTSSAAPGVLDSLEAARFRRGGAIPHPAWWTRKSTRASTRGRIRPQTDTFPGWRRSLGILRGRETAARRAPPPWPVGSLLRTVSCRPHKRPRRGRRGDPPWRCQPGDGRPAGRRARSLHARTGVCPPRPSVAPWGRSARTGAASPSTSFPVDRGA